MTETLSTILQWLLPAGGLGSVIVWLTNKTLRNARTTKEVHETYKILYENIQQTLIELQDENKKMYKAMGKLERAVNRASVCRYYEHCPVRVELQDKQGKPVSKPRGQSSIERNKHNNLRSCPDEPGGNSPVGGEPP
ncbi:hypothetical protein [Bacteroides pyogenes]|uniref:hypothetical protein n=1 Tax=Bacteroides pyogenes TaxID=310300 RepID=UPI001BAD226F|nr:hypothetical protein [Bacteroides pyogenes]MBR8726485.1 hypothetical protein [Bacteroides pyogenes]MBR8739835.1 hypothetical protein [Bacteroides pyogenes]MBR8755627.1 hypothetical protein [Bacteroides pyogenes]MBR8796926.1 hypothetical protein [Bacteroides pyogenes]MBR8810526.1 hypothetical protein [Bacteroides pyogenes]